MEIKALTFDFDGLILETEYPIFQAWRELYDDHGHLLELETYVQGVGSTIDAWNPMTHLDELQGRKLDWDTLRPQRERRIYELLEDAEPLPGVTALLEEASRRGMPCAVASSSSHRWVEGWLDRLGLSHHFAHVFCREDVEKPKPSPDLFLAASNALGHPPEHVLVLEDSQNGLRAAQAAGTPCLVVPNPITQGLEFDGAHLLFESMEHFDIATVAVQVSGR